MTEVSQPSLPSSFSDWSQSKILFFLVSSSSPSCAVSLSPSEEDQTFNRSIIKIISEYQISRENWSAGPAPLQIFYQQCQWTALVCWHPLSWVWYQQSQWSRLWLLLQCSCFHSSEHSFHDVEDQHDSWTDFLKRNYIIIYWVVVIEVLYMYDWGLTCMFENVSMELENVRLKLQLAGLVSPRSHDHWWSLVLRNTGAGPGDTGLNTRGGGGACEGGGGWDGEGGGGGDGKEVHVLWIMSWGRLQFIQWWREWWWWCQLRHRGDWSCSSHWLLFLIIFIIKLFSFNKTLPRSLHQSRVHAYLQTSLVSARDTLLTLPAQVARFRSVGGSTSLNVVSHGSASKKCTTWVTTAS